MDRPIRLPAESDAAYEARTAQATVDEALIKGELMTIQVSEDGDDDGTWMPMHAVDVPEWIKQPDTMGLLRDGTKVCFDGKNMKGIAKWWRAVRHVPEQTH